MDGTGLTTTADTSQRRRIMSIGPKDPIGELVSPAVATIGPTATLQAAAEAMATDGLGLLVVVDVNGPIGVLSERDIVVAIAEELTLDGERVRDHCASEIVSVEETATVEDAARAMAEAGIRHLAVTRRGEVCGVVSIRDVITALTA
jgi:CBS domain-containing protein